MQPNNTGKTYSRFGNHPNVVRFLKAMIQGPQSIRDISDKTSISYETVRPLIRLLHEEGVIHISHWRSDMMGRASIAVYALGIGIDAPKRKPKTGAQRSLAYKHRQEAQTLITIGNAGRIKNNHLDMALRSW